MTELFNQHNTAAGTGTYLIFRTSGFLAGNVAQLLGQDYTAAGTSANLILSAGGFVAGGMAQSFAVLFAAAIAFCRAYAGGDAAVVVFVLVGV